MDKPILHLFLALAGIALCLALGKLINALVGGLPASLYGLLLFALFLNTELLDTEIIGRAVSKVIVYMPLVFVPVCVGTMNYFDLLKQTGIQIIFVAVTATLFGVVITALLSRRVLSRHSQSDSDV